MKRKIPVFRVSVQSGADYGQLEEHPGVKEVVIEEVIVAIKEAIKTKKTSISLFEVANSGYYIELKKEQFKSSLESALEYFIEKEEYNRCAECRDLINKID
jgi:hypothetical protein